MDLLLYCASFFRDLYTHSTIAMTTDSAKIPPAAASPVTTITTSIWD